MKKKYLFLLFLVVLMGKKIKAGNYAFLEKANGEAFSTYSDLENSYLYNPSLNSLRRNYFILPISVEISGDDSLISTLKNKLKNLKGRAEEIISYLRDSNKEKLTARIRTATGYMANSFSFVFHTKADFEVELRNSRVGGEQIEFYSDLEINGTLSYSRTFFKYFGAGLSVTTRYALRKYFNRDGITLDNSSENNFSLTNGEKSLDLKFDLGFHSRYPLSEHYNFISGLTFNELSVPLAIRNENKKIDPSPSLMRVGFGLEAEYDFLKLKPAIMYTYEARLIKTRSSNPIHIGIRTTLLDMFKLSFGFSNARPSFGVVYYNGFISLGYASFYDIPKQLISNKELLHKRSLYVRLSLSF